MLLWQQKKAEAGIKRRDAVVNGNDKIDDNKHESIVDQLAGVFESCPEG